jgi:triosephosphate isomerase (TIM)
MRLIIAANWKMHKNSAETAEFCLSMRHSEAMFTGVDVLICPPHTALAAAAAVMRESSIQLGAQNMHYELNGAYTGEIGAPMLIDHGVKYVIIGHSERRHLMGEDDALINRKVTAALKSGLKPILCVGETETEREQGITESVLAKQLGGALKDINPEKTAELVVAYEPVWAIGTGKAASTDDAEGAALLIKEFFRKNWGDIAASNLRIQYGGSVKADNIASYVALPSVHGALVGGASLEADTFSSLIQEARKVDKN